MNKYFTEDQIDTLKVWSGKSIITLYPDGGITIDNKIDWANTKYQSEEFWCAMKYLDDLKIPRNNDNNEVYSIVGRIMLLCERSQLLSQEHEYHIKELLKFASSDEEV